MQDPRFAKLNHIVQILSQQADATVQKGALK